MHGIDKVGRLPPGLHAQHLHTVLQRLGTCDMDVPALLALLPTRYRDLVPVQLGYAVSAVHLTDSFTEGG